MYFLSFLSEPLRLDLLSLLSDLDARRFLCCLAFPRLELDDERLVDDRLACFSPLLPERDDDDEREDPEDDDDVCEEAELESCGLVRETCWRLAVLGFVPWLFLLFFEPDEAIDSLADDEVASFSCPKFDAVIKNWDKTCC